ncbi:MAG: alpha-2-macroglobulin, partial [Treponema sp.]|nr:alpha-2-macroglobulin [Treponema sp.]
MKKKYAMAILALLVFYGCKGSAPAEEAPDEHEGKTLDPGLTYALQGMVDAAFDLDYTPLLPEAEQEAGTVSALLSAAGSTQGATVIPPLRKLTEYKTAYYRPEQEAARIRAIQDAQEKASRESFSREGTAALTVVDWGPRGFLSSTVQRPSLFVVFSEPMVPIAALGSPSDKSDLVRINPPLKGTFRWYGTSFLSFEADEPCQSQQTYNIAVSETARSLGGKRISGERSFRFVTETLALSRIAPGENNQTRRYSGDVPPEAAKEISLYFNYPVAAGDIQPFLAVSTKGGTKNFTLVQDRPDKIIARVSGEIEFDTTVRVTLKKGAKSANATLGTAQDSSQSFNTPGPFRVTRVNRVPSHGRYRNLVEFTFSQNINRQSIRNKIRTEPAMTISDANNIEVYGTTLRVYNLPVTYGDVFTITLDGSVQDIYGRSLGAAYPAQIKVPDEPPPSGSAGFLSYSSRNPRILEAQYGSRFLFEYRNVTASSRYSLSRVEGSPFNRLLDTKTFSLKTEKNVRYFEDMNLAPFLDKNGKGFVRFLANLELLTADLDRRNNTFTTGLQNETNDAILEVTDLGVTVRSGFNRTAVLVTSLASGAPVEGARVRLFSEANIGRSRDTDLSTAPAFGEARTGKNGLAVISYNAADYRSNRADGAYDAVYVYAEKDGDKVLYEPGGHNTWPFAVSSKDAVYAGAIEPVTFLFSDRGLYKPGETVTFRGVDRSLAVGNYFIYKGNYELSLETADRDSVTIDSIEGETSGSGGFFGRFVLKDDMVPGEYRLVYRRSGSDKSANVSIRVAFFERLKFEASIKAPPETLYAGDTITMALKASYLSGGSLSGAGYEETWTREAVAFRPAELGDYRFGPGRSYDGRRTIGESSGLLGPDGGAGLRQKSTPGGVVGAPYRYTVEAGVTDISNQMISTSRSVVVHPSRFYLGVSGSRKGFAKTGEEIYFDYIALRPNGQKAAASDFLASGGNGKLRVNFFRAEWHLVQQEGVGGSVYDQYVEEAVNEKSEQLTLGSGGRLSFKAAKAGDYTMRLEADDAEGRRVLTEYSFYVTGSGYSYWSQNDSQELRLSPDQNSYNPGDTAQLLLQSPLPKGEYLITVEREGIFTEEVRHIEEGAAVIEVKIARNYVPLVYVSISSYSVRSGPPAHEYGGRDLDKPKGYFGVTAIRVNPRVKAFSVKIEDSRSVYQPGETVTLTLKAEQHGKPVPDAELTLMAVDRGVLDLIDYHVPDPINYFYREDRFPLAVSGGDSRSWLLDPVTYSVKNLAGGDEEGKLEERKDFNPTAVFEPMLKTGADGKVNVSFKLPDNLTTYRITVFGVKEDLFSLKESEIAAQNKINVREVLPRRLRERDTAEAGVLVTNLDKAPHRVSVSVSTAGVSGVTEAGLVKQPGGAFIDGKAEQAITLEAGESGVVYFDLAAQKEGYINLVFTVRSDALNERITRELIIERPYLMESVTTLGTVAAEAASAREGLVIPGWADNGKGDLTVSLDATRLGLLDAAVTYLFDYPYGCLEQRSSAVFPLVIFGEHIDAFGLKSRVSNPVKAAEAEIKKWAAYQHADGGFPYWPNEPRYSSFYVSLRIAHILAIAKEKKIAVPSSINMNRLFSYLDSEYRKVNGGYNSYLQAYVLYVFSLAGQKVDASRLAAITAPRDVDAGTLAFAGMAYRAIKRPQEAAALAERIRGLLRPTARGVDVSDPREGRSGFYFSYYGNKLEQLALILEFFVQQLPGDQLNGRILYSLLEQKRSGGYWDSTAVTVRVLSAVDALIKAENLERVNVSGIISLSGNELFRGSYRGLGAKPSGKSFDFRDAALSRLPRDKILPLEVARSGQGALYYTASLRYAIPQ